MKKANLKRVTAIILSVLMLAAAMPLGMTAAPLRPAGLLVLGDSISQGYGLSDSTKRFGDLLAAEYGITGTNYVNDAVSGQTSTELASYVAVPANAAKIAAAELITITTGGNDLMGAFVTGVNQFVGNVNDIQSALDAYNQADENGKLQMNINIAAAVATAMTDYTQTLGTILAGIKTINPTADIILLNQYSPVAGMEMVFGQNIVAMLNSAVENLNNITAAGAATAGCRVADLYTPFFTETASYVGITATPPDIHPTEAGHEKIAEILKDMIATYSENKPVTGSYKEGVAKQLKYSFTLTWGSLKFTYTDASQGEWDEDTHSYINGVQGSWSCAQGANVLTVTNHSNAPITARLMFNYDPPFSEIQGSFTDNSGLTDDGVINLASAENTAFADAPTAQAELNLDRPIGSYVSTETAIGTVTVTIS